MRMILICSQALFTRNPGYRSRPFGYRATTMRLQIVDSPDLNADDSFRRTGALGDRCASADPVFPAASAVHRPAQLPVLALLLVARRSRKVRSKTFFHQSLVCWS